MADEVPMALHYDVYLDFPDDMHLFLPKLEELSTKVKSRRKPSGYLCPIGRSRLTFRSSDKDLFCPRDGTAVVIIEADRCLYLPPGQKESIPCSIDDITAPIVKARRVGRR